MYKMKTIKRGSRYRILIFMRVLESSSLILYFLQHCYTSHITMQGPHEPHYKNWHLLITNLTEGIWHEKVNPTNINIFRMWKKLGWPCLMNKQLNWSRVNSGFNAWVLNQEKLPHRYTYFYIFMSANCKNYIWIK